MTLTAALSKAVQGLNMASKGTDLIATNIANAQTPGYVRRGVAVSELVVNGESVGLAPLRTTRNSSPESIDAVRRSQISYEQQAVITESMQKIVDAIGDVNSDYSLSARFDKFVSALKNLAETPENGALQDQALNEAKIFAQNINDISNSMQKIREDADAEIYREVQSVNESLYRLQTVSGEIVTLSSSGDVSGLQDEQERLLDKISQSFPINTTYNSDGSVRVSSKTGITLLDINVTELNYTQSNDIPPTSVYAYAGEELGSPYNSVLSPLKVGDMDITPTADKIQSLEGGRLGGLFKIRDEYTVTTQKQLDAIASELIIAFRNQDTSIPDDDLDGNPDGDSIFTSGMVGAVFDTPESIVGISNTFAVNAAIDPDQGGDKRRFRDGVESDIEGAAGDATLIRSWISSLDEFVSFDADTDLTQSQSLMSAVREFVSMSSLKNQYEKNTFQYEKGKMDNLIDIRDNAQGVNLDNEMNNLVYLQKLYAANAVVLQKAGEMLQTIIDIR